MREIFQSFQDYLKHNRKKFIDVIYDDVLSGDNPSEIGEQELYDYIEEFIAKAISYILDDYIDITKGDKDV